jgi:sugar porter (SP) family MFS transporter
MVVEGASDPVIARLIENDHTPWYKKPNLRSLYLFMIPCCLGIESTSGFDASLMNGIQSLRFWQDYFGRPTGAALGILTASFNLGALTSLPFVSIVSDHVGRRWSIIFGSAIMIVGAIMQGLARNCKPPLRTFSQLTIQFPLRLTRLPTVAMWVVSRILIGHGSVYCIVAGATIIGELGHPKERARLGAMFNAFWMVGSLTAAGVTLRTLPIQNDWSWRLPSILQIAPSLFQVTFVLFVPESPRWLISKDRGEEAMAILVKYHAEGDASHALPRAEYAQIKKALDAENENRKRGFLELFDTPGMRRRTLIGGMLGLFTQFVGNTLIANYLVIILRSIGYTDPLIQNRLNVGNQAWNLVTATVLALIVPRFPRRTMYLLCTTLLIFVYAGWTVAQARQMITGDIAAGVAVIVFIFLYSPAYNIAYHALTYTYLVELFPYYVRTKGMAWYQLFGRSAGFFGAFVNPIGLRDIQWKYLLFPLAWLVFEWVFVYYMFPETHNRTLEELTFREYTPSTRPRLGASLFGFTRCTGHNS